jgi:hypothetical protein
MAIGKEVSPAIQQELLHNLIVLVNFYKDILPFLLVCRIFLGQTYQGNMYTE